MLSFRIVVVSVAMTAAIACGGSSSSSTSPSQTPPPPAPAPGGTSSVAIPVGAASLGTSSYAPDNLNVTVGTTVTWTNTDSVLHTSTSDGQGWSSGAIAPGGQFSVAFPTTGTFPYHCTIHPGMVGNVVVR